MKADGSGFPPTFVTAASLDVLHDDALRFDARLRAAGVPGDLRFYYGVPHGFMTLTRMVPKAQPMIEDNAARLSANLRQLGIDSNRHRSGAGQRLLLRVNLGGRRTSN